MIKSGILNQYGKEKYIIIDFRAIKNSSEKNNVDLYLIPYN